MKRMATDDVKRHFTKFAAIDQSYAECGISVFENGTLVEVTRLNFKLIEKKLKTAKIISNRQIFTNRYKRHFLRECVKKLIEEDGVEYIVVERVRAISKGYFSIYAIVALGELIVSIIDAVPMSVKVYSIDTRSWKSKSVGKANATKDETILWATENYLTEKIALKRNLRPLTDNEADSIGMGVGFLNGVTIKEEE